MHTEREGYQQYRLFSHSSPRTEPTRQNQNWGWVHCMGQLSSVTLISTMVERGWYSTQHHNREGKN